MKRTTIFTLTEDGESGIVSLTGTIDPPLQTDGSQRTLLASMISAAGALIDPNSFLLTFNGEIRTQEETTPISTLLLSGFMKKKPAAVQPADNEEHEHEHQV